MTLPGVTACAFSARSQCLTVARKPDQISADALCQELARQSATPLAILPPATLSPAAASRQCPVPAGYVLALERLRFALNLRRFFIAA